MGDKPCCAPGRRGGTRTDAPDVPTGGRYDDPVAKIPGGQGLLGTNQPWLKIDGEAPLRKKRIQPFLMGQTPVTNAAFAKFVDATGYQTQAETFGWSYVFHSQLPQGFDTTQGAHGAQWWRRVDGAYWNRPVTPDGPTADPAHPVVHVSWYDAQAFAQWAGGRLPSEHEWEHAARGGLADVPYVWGGHDPDDHSHFPCNIWQGPFPHTNTAKDGYAHASPAMSFAPNGYGLYGMAGNVWDWCHDNFRIKSLSKAAKQQAAAMAGYKLIKGGSFLCHASYCTRYRIAARTGNSPDSSTTHTGFRVVFEC